jgi:uncharacterized membrane protein YozB (DUF420 family)
MLQALLTAPGFLGTQAPLHSDISLLMIVFSAVMFTLGWRLAVAGKYEVHRWVQTSAAILNTLAVLAIMIPSFIVYILPGIPHKLLEGTYGVTTVHAIIGLIGLLLGIFVVLRANGLMPEKLRFKNYKVWMRTSYGIYMLATVIGVYIYLVVYIPPGG